MKLVTGGSGYLGAHLSQALIDAGHKVRVFDVFKSPFVPEDAKFMEGDMTDINHVRRAMKNVDTVFHLAFIQSLSKRPLREKYLININGTDNFLKIATEQGVSRFVFASTIEIYSTHPPFPCTEDAPKNSPVGWYGRHKWECEKLCMKYHKKGLNVTMMRMPAICGPGHYNHGPMMDLMDRIIESKPVPLPGDGKIPANMTHYQDVIRGFILASEKKAAIGEAFNLSSEHPATHLEIMQAMKDAVDSKSILFPVPKQISYTFLNLAIFFGVTNVPDHQVGYAFHPNHYSCEKAMKMLGYRPRFSVTDSAREQILGYAQNREYVRQRNRMY